MGTDEHAEKMAKAVWIDGSQHLACPILTSSVFQSAATGLHCVKVMTVSTKLNTKAVPMRNHRIHLRQNVQGPMMRRRRRPTEILPKTKPMMTHGWEIQFQRRATTVSAGVK